MELIQNMSSGFPRRDDVTRNDLERILPKGRGFISRQWFCFGLKKLQNTLVGSVFWLLSHDMLQWLRSGKCDCRTWNAQKKGGGLCNACRSVWYVVPFINLQTPKESEFSDLHEAQLMGVICSFPDRSESLKRTLRPWPQSWIRWRYWSVADKRPGRQQQRYRTATKHRMRCRNNCNNNT